MKNLLEAIQKYPSIFIYTFQHRGSTTPSTYNRKNHNLLAEKVKEKDWDAVKQLICEKQYWSGLDGVITCLSMTDYDEKFTIEEHLLIQDLFKSGKLC